MLLTGLPYLRLFRMGCDAPETRCSHVGFATFVLSMTLSGRRTRSGGDAIHLRVEGQPFSRALRSERCLNVHLWVLSFPHPRSVAHALIQAELSACNTMKFSSFRFTMDRSLTDNTRG
jgi:hypothetical protein